MRRHLPDTGAAQRIPQGKSWRDVPHPGRGSPFLSATGGESLMLGPHRAERPRLVVGMELCHSPPGDPQVTSRNRVGNRASIGGPPDLSQQRSPRL